MLVTTKVCFDMASRSFQPAVDAVQLEKNSRCVEASLYSGGIAWAVPSGVTAAVGYAKPDGTTGIYDRLPSGKTAVTVSGSVVTAILAPQMLTVSGTVDAVIVLTDASLNQLATFPFRVNVAANPAAGATMSEDYYNYSSMEEISDAVEATIADLLQAKAEFLTEAHAALEEIRAVVDDGTDAPPIVCEASGMVISLDDSASRLLQGLNLYGKTVQNGTPTPDAPVALESIGNSGSVTVTAAGKNLFGCDFITIEGYKAYDLQSPLPAGTYTIWAEVTSTDTDATTAKVGFWLPERSAWQYIDPKHDGIRRSYTMTITEPATRVVLYSSNTLSNCEGDTATWKNLQIEFGSVATDYESPKEWTTAVFLTPNGLPGLPVPSGGNYTDADGQQWICDEVDFARGVYVQRVLMQAVTDSSIFIVANDPSQEAGTTRIKIDAAEPFVGGYGMCNCANKITQWATGANEMGLGSTNVVRLVMYFAVSGDLTLDDFKVKFANSPLVFYLILAEENTIPLTEAELTAYAAMHTNYPNTTVFNDAGAHMGLSYVADTRRYIDKKFDQLAKALVSST